MEAVQDNKYELVHQYADSQDNSKLIAANDHAWKILDEICEFVKPGVTESEATEYCYKVFEQHSYDRIWHKPFVRFGQNTVLTCYEQNKTDLILQEEDIAYVDIGVVLDGIEGDAARTLSFGNNARYQEIVTLTEDLFVQGKQLWQEQKVTGIELYRHMEAIANDRGFECHLDKAGHLIGSFPHASAKYKDGLNHFPESIEAFQWIVEVQIKDPELNVGGFYEQLLG